MGYIKHSAAIITHWDEDGMKKVLNMILTKEDMIQWFP